MGNWKFDVSGFERDLDEDERIVFLKERSAGSSKFGDVIKKSPMRFETERQAHRYIARNPVQQANPKVVRRVPGNKRSDFVIETDKGMFWTTSNRTKHSLVIDRATDSTFCCICGWRDNFRQSGDLTCKEYLVRSVLETLGPRVRTGGRKSRSRTRSRLKRCLRLQCRPSGRRMGLYLFPLNFPAKRGRRNSLRST